MKTRTLLIGILLTAGCGANISAQQPVPEKPRILISTDIGGTDPDDNQSVAHFLMYSNRFETEGLVSSPSYGNGSKEELSRMIDLYEKDLPRLQAHEDGFPTPDALRAVCKQGSRGAAPFCGYGEPTEGSEWIVSCARRESGRPLWILVWGGLDDVAQALHDAPDIEKNIRVYWIGGPNKKWSVDSYHYIIANFPDLWFIENNTSYRGFTADKKKQDACNALFYDTYVRGAGNLGADFIDYYEGLPKLGDTPSLLYMMDGDPDDPYRESWGGSFCKTSHTPRTVFRRTATAKDTVQICSMIEFYVKGPVLPIASDSACITLTVRNQKWAGRYLDNGEYMVRHSTYYTGTLPYTITSDIPGFPEQNGFFTVANRWDKQVADTDYRVGENWYTDNYDPALMERNNAGALTTSKWRNAVIEDWGKRWGWLK